MSLKQALIYFLPPGNKLSKTVKSIPPDRFEETKKRFDLETRPDFKETLSKGPYTIYVGRDANNEVTTRILILEQYWRTCYHKYAIALLPDGKVNEIVVTELNCPVAYPINRKSFLGQFRDKKVGDATKRVRLGNDIDAITGATMSSDATTIVTRRALALHDLFFSQ